MAGDAHTQTRPRRHFSKPRPWFDADVAEVTTAVLRMLDPEKGSFVPADVSRASLEILGNSAGQKLIASFSPSNTKARQELSIQASGACEIFDEAIQNVSAELAPKLRAKVESPQAHERPVSADEIEAECVVDLLLFQATRGAMPAAFGRREFHDRVRVVLEAIKTYFFFFANDQAEREQVDWRLPEWTVSAPEGGYTL